jgi:hypothetical protein
MTGELLTTNEVAAALAISRESARLLMKRTRGVIVLPPLNGSGQRQTRRMPHTVLESLLASRMPSCTGDRTSLSTCVVLLVEGRFVSGQ